MKNWRLAYVAVNHWNVDNVAILNVKTVTENKMKIAELLEQEKWDEANARLRCHARGYVFEKIHQSVNGDVSIHWRHKSKPFGGFEYKEYVPRYTEDLNACFELLDGCYIDIGYNNSQKTWNCGFSRKVLENRHDLIWNKDTVFALSNRDLNHAIILAYAEANNI